MKKSGKKLLAGAAALAMSCSMVTGWANGVEIVDVKVLNSASDQGTSFKNAEGVIENVILNTEQMLQVTVKLTDGAAQNPAAAVGDVTFLSNIDGETTLDNGTIQYVDQQTVSTTDGIATITFRPRTTLNSETPQVTNGVGAFVAKAGGTDVTKTASFNYTVVPPSIELSASISGTITEGDDAVINLSVPEGKDMPTAVTVKDGETVITGTYNREAKTLTVSGLTVGTHNITISADGYVSVSVQVTVESAEVIVDSGDTGSVTTGIQDKLANMTPSNGSVSLPGGTVTGSGTSTNYNVNYTVTTPDESKIVRGADGTISLATVGGNKVFAAKITVTASVGTSNPITASKDIYLVADPHVNISFGNIGLISTSTGADAFLNDDNFSAAKATAGDSFATTKVAIQTEVLNFALERRSPSELDNVVKPTVDYDLNGKVTLSEYRMLKLMLEGNNTNFTPSKLDTARAGWIAQNGSTNTSESN